MKYYSNFTLSFKCKSDLLRYMLLLIFVLPLLLSVGCSRNRVKNILTPEENIAIADKYYEKEKYAKAASFYERVVLERKSGYTSKAQIRLADCYFKRENWLEAKLEYEEFIRLFPDHPEAASAQYNIGYCAYKLSRSPQYTQDETIEAIDALDIYLDKYPTAKQRAEAVKLLEKCHYKLLIKTYENGLIYYKTYDYSSALMYFDRVLELNLKDNLDKKSLFYSGMIYYKRKDIEKTTYYLEKLSLKYPDSKETSGLMKKLNKLKK